MKKKRTLQATPDESWLHGKYDFQKDPYSKGDWGEINTKTPFVGVDMGDTNFFAQGEDASQIITQIHSIWCKDGRRTTKTAFLTWINLYL